MQHDYAQHLEDHQLLLNGTTGRNLGVEKFGTSFPPPDEMHRKPSFWAELPTIQVTVQLELAPGLYGVKTFTVKGALLKGDLQDYTEEIKQLEFPTQLTESGVAPLVVRQDA